MLRQYQQLTTYQFMKVFLSRTNAVPLCVPFYLGRGKEKLK